MATGIIGILASAREWCPLKSTPQKITHTIFLALSLVSLAIAQLVVALAATGAARDINNSEYEGDDEDEVRFRFDKIIRGGTTSGKNFSHRITISSKNASDSLSFKYQKRHVF